MIAGGVASLVEVGGASLMGRGGASLVGRGGASLMGRGGASLVGGGGAGREGLSISSPELEDGRTGGIGISPDCGIAIRMS